MGKIILVTGGARSGKSSFAEQMIKDWEKERKSEQIAHEPEKITHKPEKIAQVLYIATAVAFDEEMKNRIKKHRDSRPASWRTLEKYSNFHEIDKEPEFAMADFILVDCIGVMLNNIMFDEIGEDADLCALEVFEQIEEKMISELTALYNRIGDRKIVLVTNEVGLGIVPENRLTRFYRDILGRANRFTADRAEEVYLIVAGQPLKIKG